LGDSLCTDFQKSLHWWNQFVYKNIVKNNLFLLHNFFNSQSLLAIKDHQRTVNDDISGKAFGHFFFLLCTPSQTIRLASSHFYHYLLPRQFGFFSDAVIKYLQGFIYVKITEANSLVSYRTSKLVNVCALRLSQTRSSMICSSWETSSLYTFSIGNITRNVTGM